MARLTGLDGAFLALESPTTHLHIMGAMVFDPPTVPGGLGFRRIRALVAERLPLVPPFRMRMVEVPFGLQHPTLVDDPDFDLDYHVRRASLPGAGGHGRAGRPGGRPGRPAARPVAARCGSSTWSRAWRAAASALVAKVHHAIIDGVSGAEVLAAFFDLSPDPTPRPLFGRPDGPAAGCGPDGSRADDGRGADGGRPAPGAVVARPAAGGARAAARRARSLPGQVDAVARTVVRTVQTARALSARNREVPGTLPPAPFQAPQTSINGAISPHRRVAFADLPLTDIRRVRRRARRHDQRRRAGRHRRCAADVLRRRGARSRTTSLVALVPVSVRTEAEQGALGNRVSAMLVSLATGVADPVARLGRIREGMAGGQGAEPGGRTRTSTRRGPRRRSRRWPPGCPGWSPTCGSSTTWRRCST